MPPRTHCGVDDFTAEEGTCALPPAVALSLAKERGVDWLVGRSVRLRFVQLPQEASVSVTFQPRGQGFHVGDKDVVNIDIKAVLLRTLRDTLTLTEGDWVPVRHDGRTFELVLTQMRPAPAMLILDTDVEVDLAPSADVQREEERAEGRSLWLQARAAQVALKRKALERSGEPGEASGEASKEVVALRLRLPQGKAATRRFRRGDPLSAVLDWAQTLLPSDVPAETPTGTPDLAELLLVRPALRGAAAETFGADVAGRTLEEAGVGSARESLLVKWAFLDAGAGSLKEADVQLQARVADVDVDMDGKDVDGKDVGAKAGPSRSASTDAAKEGDAAPAAGFSKALQQSEQTLDLELEAEQLRRAMQVDDGSGAEGAEGAGVATSADPDKVHVYHALVASSVAPMEAARAAQRFSRQIVELETMGFGDLPRNIELLEKYQGRLQRVVNLLAGAD